MRAPPDHIVEASVAPNTAPGAGRLATFAQLSPPSPVANTAEGEVPTPSATNPLFPSTKLSFAVPVMGPVAIAVEDQCAPASSVRAAMVDQAPFNSVAMTATVVLVSTTDKARS